MKKSRFYALSLSALALVIILPQAQAYTWTATAVPSLGGQYATHSVDINNARQIVGYADVGSHGLTHAFLYEPGVAMRDLGSAGSGLSSRATHINDSGQIVGWSETGVAGSSSRSYSDYIYKDGVATPVTNAHGIDSISNGGLIAGSNQYWQHAAVVDGRNGQILWTDTRSNIDLSRATAINNSGQVVGVEEYFLGDNHHAFYHDLASNTTTSIATGTDYSEAMAINDAGRVVGTAFNQYDPHAFVYFNGVTTIFNTPLAPYSRANDINNQGEIAGALELQHYGDGFGLWHAYFYGSEGLVDLNDGLTLPEGEYLSNAIAMNDHGDILATGSLGHSWLLTTSPVPEPETWALLLAGLGLGAWVRRRRTSEA